MLDINKRVRCEGTTVAEMIEALQRLPQDGIVHFEGKNVADTSFFSGKCSRIPFTSIAFATGLSNASQTI